MARQRSLQVDLQLSTAEQHHVALAIELYAKRLGTLQEAAAKMERGVDAARYEREAVRLREVPSTNPTAGGVLHAEGGALKYRGSGGTVTTLGNA